MHFSRSIYSSTDRPPADLKEAQELYKTLGDKLGPNEENVIPQTVYLYPLKYITENPLLQLMKVNDTLGRMTVQWKHRALGHSLVHSYVHLQCSLICWLNTVCRTRAFRCAHLLPCSYEPSLPHKLIGSRFLSRI